MLPERLKTLRLKIGLTQKEISKKLNVSQSTYSDWEKGKMKPKNLQQIADFFDVSINYLSGQTDYIDRISQSIIQNLYEQLSPNKQKELILIAQRLFEEDDIEQ
ncbi:hypothetical protein RyT2_07620 [Pseudolactococcus yaeyamensis]